MLIRKLSKKKKQILFVPLKFMFLLAKNFVLSFQYHIFPLLLSAVSPDWEKVLGVDKVY